MKLEIQPGGSVVLNSMKRNTSIYVKHQLLDKKNNEKFSETLLL